MNSNELEMLKAEVLNVSIGTPILTIHPHPNSALRIYPTDLLEMINATIDVRRMDADYDRQNCN